jgi:hypothetical protein
MEIGVAPAVETITLYEQLLGRRFEPGAAPKQRQDGAYPNGVELAARARAWERLRRLETFVAQAGAGPRGMRRLLQA